MSQTTVGELLQSNAVTGAVSAAPRGVQSTALCDETLILRDGSRVQVRAIHPEDEEPLRAFHRHLSRDAIIYRFFHYFAELPPKDASYFTHVDYLKRMAIIATVEQQHAEVIIAVGRYDWLQDATAEVAVVVTDAWQGHGLATALLYRLASYARARGMTRFVAYTLNDNRPMIEVLQHAGFPRTAKLRDGVREVSLDIARPPASPLGS